MALAALKCLTRRGDQAIADHGALYTAAPWWHRLTLSLRSWRLRTSFRDRERISFREACPRAHVQLRSSLSTLGSAVYAALVGNEVLTLRLGRFALAFFLALMLSISGFFYARHRNTNRPSLDCPPANAHSTRYGRDYASVMLESRVMTSFTTKSYLLKDKILD